MDYNNTTESPYAAGYKAFENDERPDPNIINGHDDWQMWWDGYEAAALDFIKQKLTEIAYIKRTGGEK